MRIFTALLAVFLFGGAVANAQWKRDGEPSSNTADRKSINGFGANLVLVKDPQGFMKEWEKPKSPEINLATEAKRGEVLGAFVLFAGCKPDANGACNSEVDFAVYKPDGTLYAEQKGQSLWKEQAPPAPNIQMGRAILGIRMENDDPAGAYTVKAKVTDLNANVSFELETKFQLK